VAVAAYVTGEGTSELPMLVGMLGRKDLRKDIGDTVGDVGLALVLRLLTWPAGREFLEAACAVPFVHAGQVENAGRTTAGEVRDYILDPGRLERSLRKARPRTASAILTPLLRTPKDSPVSLLVPKEPARHVLRVLADSSSPPARAAAAYARGYWDEEASRKAVARALGDEDPRVRRAAAQSFVRLTDGRKELEARLAPLLDDEADAVADMAATGLLLPEVRATASLDRGLTGFSFGDKVHVWASYRSGGDSRPLRPLNEEPPFLPGVRRRLEKAMQAKGGGKGPVASLALLLAQYGDSTGVDKMVAAWSQGDMASVPDAIIAGIALSRDVKHLDILRRAAAGATSKSRLRDVLKAIRGMRGAEARNLRRQVNRRMRRVKGY
jgi:hypothetical protein